MPESDYIHKNATVIITRDEPAGLSLIFIIKNDEAMAITFPFEGASSKIMTVADMELFFLASPDSEGLKAIREAWQERQRLQ